MIKLWRAHPFNGRTLVRAESATVWDSEGRAYADLRPRGNGRG
jgi:acetylornithine/succinyldiaminopimelate/putrescine aminotransferase